MQIEVTGLTNKIEALSSLSEQTKEVINSKLHEYGEIMVNDAKSSHRFRNRSGVAQDSIQYEVNEESNELKFGILEDTHAIYQHEGTYLGYKQSKYSPYGGGSTPSTGYGIEADHFIDRAVENNENQLIADLEDVISTTSQEAFDA